MSSKWLQTVTCIFAFYAKFGRCAVFSQKQCDGGCYVKVVSEDIPLGTSPTLIWGRLRPFLLLKKAHFCRVPFCILRKIRSLRSFFSKTMRWRVMLRIEIERHSPWEESHTIFHTCFLIFDCQINHQGEN